MAGSPSLEMSMSSSPVFILTSVKVRKFDEGVTGVVGEEILLLRFNFSMNSSCACPSVIGGICSRGLGGAACLGLVGVPGGALLGGRGGPGGCMGGRGTLGCRMGPPPMVGITPSLRPSITSIIVVKLDRFKMPLGGGLTGGGEPIPELSKLG